MKTIQAEGMTPQLAFNNQAMFSIENDETYYWKKQGEPDLLEFAEAFINGQDPDMGEGFFIEIRAPKTITPKKEVKLENIVNSGARKWQTVYEYIDGQTEEEVQGLTTGTKTEAIASAKALAKDLHTDIHIKVGKALIEGNKTAAIVRYQTVKEIPGEYFFFGVESDLPF